MSSAITAVNIDFLKEKARILRIEILKMLTEAGSCHTGGSLSGADIATALYFYKMRHNPKDPKWKERDRFILSKGHAAPLLYAALALSGYFDKQLLKTLRKVGRPLQGHPCSKKLPGVEVSTGSLGMVLSIEPIVNKWEAFGWHVIDINGHDMKAILNAFNEAERVKSKPTMIVARTVKGKGVSFFEGKVQYHGIAPTREELERALKELGGDGK